MPDINVVALTGNLTSDAQLRSETVLAIRLAVTGSRKIGDEWQDVPNYFDVTVFGNRASALQPYLKTGTRVAVSGRLEWREWEQEDQKRQAVQVIASEVVLLGSPKREGEPPTSP